MIIRRRQWLWWRQYLKAMKPLIAGWESDFGKGDDDQKQSLA